MEKQTQKRPAAKYRAYVLRTCDSDLTSYYGFQWPETGYVEAPDWDYTPECGGGLHGALWGEGDGSLLDWTEGAKWLVVEVDIRTVIDLNGKVKFPYGWVVFCGDRPGATNEIRRLGARGPVIGATVCTGKYGRSYAGYKGIAHAGSYGRAVTDSRGTSNAGYSGTAVSGQEGAATAGDYGTAIAGHNGTATVGIGGTAIAGYCGKAIAGYCGKASAGSYGTATAGTQGVASAGYEGKVAAGEDGELRISYYYRRRRTALAYVGEEAPGANGPIVIQPNQKYELSIQDDGSVCWVPTS